MTPAAALDLLRREAEEAAAKAAALQEALRNAEALERHDALMTALGLYAGPLTRRAHTLAREYQAYLNRAWLRERDLSELPDSATPMRRALHRLARSRDGEELKARRIYDLAQKCNGGPLRLHKFQCEASRKEVHA